MRVSCFNHSPVCSDIAKAAMLTMLGSSKGEVEKEIGAYKKKKKTNKQRAILKNWYRTDRSVVLKWIKSHCKDPFNMCYSHLHEWRMMSCRCSMSFLSFSCVLVLPLLISLVSDCQTDLGTNRCAWDQHWQAHVTGLFIFSSECMWISCHSFWYLYHLLWWWY